MELRLICSVLLILLINERLDLVKATDSIFVTDGERIYLPDGGIWSGPVNIPSGPLGLTKVPITTPPATSSVSLIGVDYDASKNIIYWSEVDDSTSPYPGKIKKFDVATGIETVLVSSLILPGDVVLDVDKQTIYWMHNNVDPTEPHGLVSRIEKANIEPPGCPSPPCTPAIFVDENQGISLSLGITLDPFDEYLYWADLTNGKIERIKTSGTNRLVLVTNLAWPSGITLDFADRRLFWCDSTTGSLESIDFDGNYRRHLYTVQTPSSLFSIAAYGTLIYWGDWRWTTLFRINKYTGVEPDSVEIAAGEVINRPLSMHVHQDDPEDSRCTMCCAAPSPGATQTVLKVVPTTGSMLGGDILRISGACSNMSNGTDYKCRFDGTIVVDGNIYTNPGEVICVTPTLFKIGRVSMEISFDGGFNYKYQAFFTMLSVEQTVPGVTRSTPWSNNALSYGITWDNSVLNGFVSTVGVNIYSYSESTSGPSLISIATVSSSQPYSMGTISFFKPVITPDLEDRVLVIKVYDYDVGSVNGAAMWSDVHSAWWLRIPNKLPSNTCPGWDANDVVPTIICPCSLAQALADFGKFSPHPACNTANSMNANNCLDEYNGAKHCVRATQPSVDNAGQECCYRPDGIIIEVDQSSNTFSGGGGFAHESHHAGVTPYGANGKVPYLSHFLNDLEPRLRCCVFTNGPSCSSCCKDYKAKRPSQTLCNGYTPPTPGVGAGDPHFLTLDGTTYTFNGKGEYVLLQTYFPESENFLLQGRTDTLSSAEFDFTVFVACAAQYGSSDAIHIELHQTRLLDVWVKYQADGSWDRLHLAESQWWDLKGVSISASNVTEHGLLVLFDGGISLRVRTTVGSNRVMSIIFLGPDTLMGFTRGLLGTWNGNPDDDLLTPTGDTIAADTSTEDIHVQFGQQWQINAEESLFYYSPLYDADSYRDESFVPVFSPPINPNVAPDDVIAHCGGDEWCIFDFHATGDMEIAMASRDSYEEQAAIVEASMNIVICSLLTHPVNGHTFVTRTTVGGVATYNCNDGFILMGMEQRVCQGNGIWFGQMPSCALIPVIGPSSFTLRKSVYIVLETVISLKITILRSGDIQIEGHIRLSMESVTATPATDYVSYSEQIQFKAGVEAIDRYISIRDDDVREELESFEIRLDEPINSDLGMPDMATVFIEDDEVEHFFRDIIYSVPENYKSVRLTVQKIGYLGPTAINYITIEDTAKSTEDFSRQTSTVKFEQDNALAYIDITIRNDNVYEEAEQFSVILQSHLPGQIGLRDTAIVNIENDDELCFVPCENGGVCTDIDTCTCSSAAFFGQYCQLDSCTRPCQNGGTCTGFSTCTCAEGFNGFRCEYPICNPCQHGGTCSAPNTCSCTASFTGDTCTETVCFPPCLNGGVCNEFHTCTCPFEYRGGRCMFPADNNCLYPNLCGGEEFKCVETSENFKCKCADGYYSNGDQCLLASRVIVGKITVLNVDEMPLMYRAILLFSGSREFTNLEDIFVRVLSGIFRYSIPGFLEVKIRRITEGSIIVEYEVLLNEISMAGSQDVLNVIKGNISPIGILSSTLIRLDPTFTSIILELCPPRFCGENGICQPAPLTSASVCICNDGYSGDQCSEMMSNVADDEDEFSVAVIAGLGIVVFVMLVAIPVGVYFCYRQIRKFRYLKAQRTSRISLTNQRPLYQLPVYWFAGDSQVFLPPLYTSNDLTALSWENYL